MDIDIFYDIMGQNNYQGNSQTTFTPDSIAKEMIDSLPDTVWNDKQTFLDVSCKTGVFLKHIYNKLDIALAKLNEYKDPIKRREHILRNQIYALCIDNDFQLLQAQRNLYGCIGRYNNIAYMENYSKLIKERDNTRFKNRLQELFNRMTFNVVVGNPPYNRGGHRLCIQSI